MFGVSSWEMMLLFVVALLLFGKRLPEVARSLGKGMMEFKKGLYDIQDEVTSAANTRPATSQSRPIPLDSREEATAPKFEPPKYEPSEAAPEQTA
jgi:sec-independent protein translocase protein TatA